MFNRPCFVQRPTHAHIWSHTRTRIGTEWVWSNSDSSTTELVSCLLNSLFLICSFICVHIFTKAEQYFPMLAFCHIQTRELKRNNQHFDIFYKHYATLFLILLICLETEETSLYCCLHTMNSNSCLMGDD